MRAIIVAILILLVKSSFSQDTTYYDSNEIPLSIKQWYSYYKVKNYLSDDSLQVRIEKFDSLNNKVHEWNYSNFKLFELDQTEKTWYSSGQLKYSCDYNRGVIDGKIYQYFSNGDLRREDSYQNDRLISGNLYDKQGNKLQHEPLFVHPYHKKCKRMNVGKKRNECTAYYIQRHIIKKTKYPAQAMRNKIEGVVYLRYNISAEGEVYGTRVVKGIEGGELLEKESIRVIRSLPKMVPGKQNGQAVNVTYTIPIRFNLGNNR